MALDSQTLEHATAGRAESLQVKKSKSEKVG
jgi:hypothetical protein